MGIGTNIPDPSALLEVQSKDQGLHIPRLTNAELDAIPSPVQGLLIFNSSSKKLNVFTGTEWLEFSEEINAGAAPAGNNTTGNVGIGTATPDQSSILEIYSAQEGLLLPRTSTGSIASPATGLMIFNTSNSLLTYYNGTIWVDLCGTPLNTTIVGGISIYL